MTPQDHYLAAETALAAAETAITWTDKQNAIGVAQVHATLATADPADLA